MIENVGKFKELINDCGINESQLQEIFKKYDLGDVYEEEIREDDFDVSSNSEFEYHIKNGNIKSIPEDMIQFISLNDFYATTEHEFILDAYYSKYQFLDVRLINPDNRAWVYDYLTKNNKRKSITFGLDQDWDIERLLDGRPADKNLDFKNWDPRQNMSVFRDGELRLNLFRHICNLYRMYLIGDEFYPLLQELLINHNGFELLTIANQYGDDVLRRFIYDFVKNELIRNMSVMKALSEYYIENDHIVYMLVMSMQGSSEFHWPAQYVNFDSVVRYVKNANMHIKNGSAKMDEIEYTQTELDAFSEAYIRASTNIHDEKIKKEFTSSAGFTIPPLMYRLIHLIARYRNTGKFDPTHLLKCEIQKPDYPVLIDFMLNHMNSKHIEIMLKEDVWFEFDVFRNNRLRRADTIELITKFPDLIVYFAN